ncbi:polysaccharide deacetylase family protein [Trichloromonas sp.]|uniref:polysaccharide deacetylase family protein n=1 Tax=Trichloromonas sp. TaxID=3069249 RepID=UPI003D81BB76
MLRLSIFCLFLLLTISPAYAEGQANVFVYHRFGDSRYPSTNIPLETFADQLELLKRQNYTVLTLGEIVSRLGAGRALPRYCAAITVDDAYRSFLAGAMPLLRRYGYPATLFVSTDSVGGDEFLSWDELRSLSAQGIEIGNHTASHPYLLNRNREETDAAWFERIRLDIERASQALRRELGQEPRLFAYPYGEYTPEVVALISELGFAGATVQHSGVVSAMSNRFALPRFPMGGDYATLAEFSDKLSMRPLVVQVIDGQDPVVRGNNPPELVVDILSSEVDLTQVQCFVQGQQGCVMTADPAVPGRYRVRAQQPLDGRRSRYTITAPGSRGQGWFWFSQLWIFPQR